MGGPESVSVSPGVKQLVVRGSGLAGLVSGRIKKKKLSNGSPKAVTGAIEIHAGNYRRHHRWPGILFATDATRALSRDGVRQAVGIDLNTITPHQTILDRSPKV